MDINQIMYIFDILMSAFSPAITVILGVMIAASVLVWILKRVS
jgi:hypothetical protein